MDVDCPDIKCYELVLYYTYIIVGHNIFMFNKRKSIIVATEEQYRLIASW